MLACQFFHNLDLHPGLSCHFHRNIGPLHHSIRSSVQRRHHMAMELALQPRTSHLVAFLFALWLVAKVSDVYVVGDVHAYEKNCCFEDRTSDHNIFELAWASALARFRSILSLMDHLDAETG